MATDTAHHHHHHHYDNSWSFQELPASDHEGTLLVSESEILDHGSTSFGRFAAESLSWEKFSVFTHDKCQEELDKFKSPGFVSEKKAYFEEYYKKIRAMKALQTEQQETIKPDYCQNADRGSTVDICQNGESNTTQVENGVDAAMLVEEKKVINVSQLQISDSETTTYLNSCKRTVDRCPNAESSTAQGKSGVDAVLVEEKKVINVSQIQISDSDATTHLNSCRGNAVDITKEVSGERQSSCIGKSDRVGIPDETATSLSPVNAGHLIKEASSAHTPSINRISAKASLAHTSRMKRSSVVAQKDQLKDQLVSNAKPKKEPHVIKSKGTVVSTANKTELDCQTTTDGAKSSQMPKSSLQRGVASKTDNNLVASKRIIPKGASNRISSQVSSHRQLTKLRSSSNVMCSSLTKDKMLSSSSSLRNDQVKACSSPKGLADKVSRSLPVLAQSSQVVARNGNNRLGLSKTITPKGANNISSNQVSTHGQLTKVHSNSMPLDSLVGDKTTSSSSSIRNSQVKAHSSPRSQADKISRDLAQSSQICSKLIGVTGGLRKMALGNRTSESDGVATKSLELSRCSTRPRDRESETEKPEIMSSNLLGQNKSNQNVGAGFGCKSYIKEGKGDKGVNTSNNRIGKDPKPAPAKLSSIRKVSSSKMVHKITPRSSNLTIHRREPRQKRPPWR